MARSSAEAGLRDAARVRLPRWTAWMRVAASSGVAGTRGRVRLPRGGMVAFLDVLLRRRPPDAAVVDERAACRLAGWLADVLVGCWVVVDALGDGLADALGDGFADALGDGFVDALGDALGDGLADALGDGLGDALGDGFAWRCRPAAKALNSSASSSSSSLPSSGGGCVGGFGLCRRRRF